MVEQVPYPNHPPTHHGVVLQGRAADRPVLLQTLRNICNTRKRSLGPLAQELQKEATHMVKPWTLCDHQGGQSEQYFSNDNRALDFMMINALKEQQTMIGELRDELSTLRLELEELRRTR